ncbi:hypothetical protein KUV50_00720 [Membranicola marinus]|uniref:Uncharacterized protein n=1 Tax=Membranihabitans marinus TaxID=1227546 RepID=A0A953L9G8_9BACT|nr:hypothetical protein [Membranihabitans marinus]MBY5956636.1 hypothetical protein [Membranihabitans marinus]
MIHIQNELKAMADTYSIISQLSLPEQNRVIEWLKNKVNEQRNEETNSENGHQDESEPVMFQDNNDNLSSFISIAAIRQYKNLKELLADINIKSSSDKTLLAAAFLKTKRGMTEFKARDISNALKEIGESVPNITLSVQQLMKKDLLKFIEGAKQGKRIEKKLEFTEFGEEIVQRAMENKELMLRRLR